jgi:hypothetical protein
MRKMLMLAVLADFASHGAALAQSAPSPRENQAMIADGQVSAALGQLRSVLAARQ